MTRCLCFANSHSTARTGTSFSHYKIHYLKYNRRCGLRCMTRNKPTAQMSCRVSEEPSVLSLRDLNSASSSLSDRNFHRSNADMICSGRIHVPWCYKEDYVGEAYSNGLGAKIYIQQLCVSTDHSNILYQHSSPSFLLSLSLVIFLLTAFTLTFCITGAINPAYP